MTAEIMTYLIDMDVDPKLLQLSLSVPSDDMRYLTASEMRSYRVISGDISNLPNQIATSKAAPTEIPAAGEGTGAKSAEMVPVPASTEQKALAFMTAYHDAWSMENESALQFMDRAYGDVVEFYGKATPKAGVIDEKRRFAMRWPTRAYSVKPGSEHVSCATTCRVDGVVDWYAKRGVGDRVSSGSAEFSLVWNPSNERIVSETGKVIETDKGVSQPVRLISQWHQENLHCRGSSGNSAETLAACDRRETIGEKLESVSWCYGREGEYGYQLEWHPCDSRSSKSNVAATATEQVASVLQPKPADYPSRARMKGKTVLPDFKKRDRDFNSFRTRIREGMKQGPNFAGHYSVIQFGCGTGCSGVVVADNQTGRPDRFPRGGEENMYLDLQFQVDSRLLAAQWLEYGTNRCVIEFFDYDRQTWKVVSKVDVGGADACYRSISNNIR
ncbi:hypothetical protein [Sinorhizobium sp. BJ1]|uniref:hypothetical protein n=1 Tax=Sinorhizobium sp. BJ1 TaxID=2035455 RepID=UPI000BEAE242|nr:hypothetical protein [Sinorhizobium sp. BJ1]PDT79782.1 hypothetical protein CO676_31330 [Sinorhizobium sp. BJ1]